MLVIGCDAGAVGTSMGAVCALFLGLTAGCGHVIAGASPVTMGRMLRRFAKLDGPSDQTKAAANEFLALADNGTDDSATFLDELIPPAVDTVSAPTRIDLFVTPQDHSYKATRGLEKRLRDNPHITAELTLGDYGSHADVIQPFIALTREVSRTADSGRRRGARETCVLRQLGQEAQQ